MQFHYVVMFDSDTKKWSVDASMTDNLDGNVYSDEDGFFWPAPEYPNSELIDQRCWNMLNALVTIWPAVDTGV